MTGGENTDTNSSGSGPKDSVACSTPIGMNTEVPGSRGTVPCGVTSRPRPDTMEMGSSRLSWM